MKKLLIIGIDSFTGQHLKSYLEKDNFDIYGTALEYSDKKVFKCDITVKNEIKNIIEDLKPEYIINLAGISFVATVNKEAFYNVNVLAVENILESIIETNMYTPKKVLLVSSATVYGNQDKDVLDESMTPNPVNHYGVSKLAMEQIVKTYFSKLNIVITRPFNYTGIGQPNHFLIPKIIKHYRDHEKLIELGNVDVYREFNDVEFVCEIYKKLILSDVRSEIVNICSNRVIALKDIIYYMNQIAEYEIKININPKFIRENEIIKLSGSTQKLFNLIGNIEQKDFKETLLDMYQGK